MLNIPRQDYEAIRQHGEETYPHECCGVLLGQMDEAGIRTVTSTARAGNTRTDSAHNRYNIDPKELIRIQREAALAEKTSSASTTPTRIIPPSGRPPISPKPTGSVAPTSSPAWKRAKPC